MDQQQRQEGPAERLIVALYLLASVAFTLWQIWEMLPQHQRTALRMRLLRSSAQATTAICRRAGAASLANEARTGRQDYGVPLRLGLASLALERAYDQARNAT